MADFENIYSKVISKYEGGYSNDPHDKGGETYKGISREYNPQWGGWDVIDSLRDDENFPLCLEWNNYLQVDVKEFYKNNYFHNFYGNKILDNVAEELFDITINFGLKTGIELFQCALNILNDNQRLYLDIEVDGICGHQTYEAFLSCIALRGSGLLVKVLNIYQGSHYIQLMERNGANERWIGWFNRVEF